MRDLRPPVRSLGLAALVLGLWIVSVYHSAVYPAPPKERLEVRPEVASQSKFLPRDSWGLNHLVVFGSPYERGLATGRLTAPLIKDEERALVTEFNKFFPHKLSRWALEVGAMRWFVGIDRYLYPWATDEMYGVSRSASPEFDYLIDPFTRQVVYHGVHELGQMFVDFEKQDFGCTLLGVPGPNGWLLGRNFDFEAVRLLDTEKVVKWGFPDAGHAYVAVTWAGMVGAVTGVNDQGVYVSINAAGTSDFRRYGTPTTLVALKALEEASTAREAVRIIEDATVFISDLFVVADRADQGLYVIEKTPKRFHTTRSTAPRAVTNHFTSPEFQNDSINAFRMREQTTVARLARAQELVDTWRPPAAGTPLAAATSVVAMLRDKRGPGGQPLHLGNRNALDALIATHSVVYDAGFGQLWVSQGPALTGPYLGYDLNQSFAARKPVKTGEVPADPELGPGVFAALKKALGELSGIRKAVAANQCRTAAAALVRLDSSPARDHYEYLMTAGDYYKTCRHDVAKAKDFWRRSLAANPAYLKHQTYLKEVVR